MVKTRRKSKAAAAAAAAAAAEQDHETASTQGTEDFSFSAPTSFIVPIPPDLDLDTLSHILPDVSFAKPDPETVLAVYRLLLAQVADQDDTRRDLEELRADMQRKDIELDQAIQDGETKTKDLEETVDTLQKEVTTIKQERDQLVASNKDLETRVSLFTSSQSSSVSDLDHLRNRVEETEREKRDLIGVVSRLKEDTTQRDEEIQSLRSSLRQARQDHQALDTQVRELRSTETSTKFKLETFSQQLSLAQSEADRVNNELTAKSEEYANYRRTKHAEFVQLQSAHDSLTQKHALVDSSLRAMQSTQAASTQQLTQALTKVQDLQGRLAEQEAAFTAEASGLKRLVTIMEEREKQAKEIVENIEREWAGVGDRAEQREAVLRAETEKERHAREEVEKRLEQLETVMERMHRGELPVAGRSISVPATPGRSSTSPDLAADAMLGLSPTVAMASKVQKSGKTFTQVYADYVRLEEEYAKKSAEYDHMDRTLSDVLAQIEERAPVLAQQREEYEHLREECTQLSNQLSIALAERDANAGSFQEASQKLKKSHQEADLLQHQLTDLGRQVQTLLKDLGRRTDPSIPLDEELDEMAPLPADNIDAVITNNLVLFRSIPSLQEQNQKLLRIVRELGAKMEAEERDYREALEKEQSEAVREAHEAMQDLATQLEREKKSSQATIQAYMKENDALKAMLARAQRTSSRGVVNGDVNGAAPAPSSDLVAELENVQAQFESYKVEMGMDAEQLREDFAQAQRQLGQANAALAKATAKIEFLDERQRMTQEQLNMQSRDLDSLALRNQQLYDQQTRLDIDRERVMDELAVTKGDLEQLRNEAANLRAEKKIWENVQNRLAEENKNLATERSQLSHLMANVQRMHNDLERSGENDRRRLESQVQMVENQTQDLKSQLSQERENLRHITLQRDIDVKELQSRLDKTTGQLSQARESLVRAETSKTHLQERVEDLARQLQGNTEKLAVYERRSSGASAAAPAPDPDLPREQQLEQEVADLRAQLKVAQVDLAAARNHMQQFQEISQANEAALAALNSTHDEYKADAEVQIARHELEFKSLEEKLHSDQQDLQQWTNKFSDLQKTLETERSAWANDKKTLEDTIVDMSTSERHSENDRAAHEREVRALEERAVAAEDRYSREVVTHAESFKTIENIKQQLSTAQAAVRQNQAETANAQAKLEASEGSWRQQKEALDKEVADLTARCKDLAAQNTLLYQHLDSVSSQATRIRQVADSTAESTNGDADVGDEADTKLSELRSVVAYLRKEKEIVDLQLELGKQENVRLKAQLDYLSQSLQEVRKTLSEERERAVQAATSDAQHAEMLERINQLNILRESNATLRADCETYSKRSRELDAKLKALSTKLEPAKEQARVARAELQARDAQISLLENESKRWQERNTQLLSKYDRIDPAELQTLKEEVENLKTQKADLEKRLSERDAMDSESATKMATYDENMRKLRSMTNNLRQQLGASNSEKSALNRTLADLQAELKSVVVERDSLRNSAGTGAELTSQVELLRQEKVALEKALADEKASKAAAAQSTPLPDQTPLIEGLRSERDKLLVEKESWSKSSWDSSDTLKAQLETERAELMQARDEALERLKAAEERANKAINDARNVKQSNEKFQVRVSEMQRTRESAIASAVEKAKSEINTNSAAAPNTEGMMKKHAQEMETLRAEHEVALKRAVEIAVAAAKAESTTDDATKAAIEAAAIADHDKKMQAKHADEISAAVDRGRMEQVAKSKLKDAQLVRSQNKLKELEAQVLEWRKAGLVPDATVASAPAAAPTVPASPAVPAPSPATPTTPVASTSKAPIVAVPVPAAPARAPAAAAPASTSAPAPPTGAGPARRALGGAVPLGTTDGTGARGRGVPRGRGRGLSIRGAAPGHTHGHGQAGTGPSPSAAATAAAASSSTTTVGVQIMGAANKRGREDETASDDSLVKRLKPAAGDAASTGSSGAGAGGNGSGTPSTAGGSNKPPFAIRRPPPS
ncbi:hypothetical protein L210DRAFT_3620711 [Boletus edulis BED1]|uniref:Nucleoprotein TPR/MLP1 domain-containing protein n=1 Tax=Boletus edulis BED1 TaxID=1328754 RepID=A0AAD4BYZ4_BOLED|nr:hypothetical protein L210DRAFT_3620711 [Boletus edulis BED1]